MKDWPEVFRTLHLPGGLRVAEIGPGKAEIVPLKTGGIAIEVTSYANIGNDARKVLGLPVIGCEFFRTKEEIEGLDPPSWRPIPPSKLSEWPTTIAELNWSGLSYAAEMRGDSRLYLIAGAITSQQRFVANRLLDLSNIYFRVLSSFMRKNTEFSEEIAVSGAFSDEMFSSIHAAFFELATLRDYFAEYIGFTKYGRVDIDDMKKLFTKVIGKKTSENALEKEIQTIYGQGGWLKDFSDLRNTFAHRMPFDRLAGSGVVQFHLHNPVQSVPVWMLHVPVPQALERNHRTNFQLPENTEISGTRMFSELKDARARVDTLAYVFETFGRLIDFGNRLSMPYEPVMPTLTDDMTISLELDGERVK